MKKISLFAVCALALLTSIAVFAQDQQGQPGPGQRGAPDVGERIKRIDTNNDGAVSRDEWKGKPEVFDRIDKNSDGSLTREEFGGPPRRHGHPGRRLNQLDTNNDDQISRDEWKGKPEVFDRIDKNGNGSLTLEEFGPWRRHGGRLKQLDTNNDGQLSRDEWKGDENRFNRLDANSDGVITEEDIRSGRQNRPNPPGI